MSDAIKRYVTDPRAIPAWLALTVSLIVVFTDVSGALGKDRVAISERLTAVEVKVEQIVRMSDRVGTLATSVAVLATEVKSLSDSLAQRDKQQEEGP